MNDDFPYCDSCIHRTCANHPTGYQFNCNGHDPDDSYQFEPEIEIDDDSNKACKSYSEVDYERD